MTREENPAELHDVKAGARRVVLVIGQPGSAN